MRFVMFYHSVRSDWNHGNAHFLRGVATELVARGHDVVILEPADGWSASNLVAECGAGALDAWRRAYPTLRATPYDPASIDLHRSIDGADVVLVHEWNAPDLVSRLGSLRAASNDFVLLFHDTHHRAVTDPAAMAAYDLRHYDGVLAYGAAIRDLYLRNGWSSRAWVWHEAADTRVFHPLISRDEHESIHGARDAAGELVWIGNWGDDERTAELEEYLIGPVRDLGLRALIYGVRYPEEAKRRLTAAGIRYGGWLPNYEVPRVFARFAVTVHVPRRPYVRALPGIPTIRVFEALACGIPLVSAPWDDTEGLFTPGEDYLVARSGADMRRALRSVLADADLARDLVANGLRTIRERHTCAHRADELTTIVQELRGTAAEPAKRLAS